MLYLVGYLAGPMLYDAVILCFMVFVRRKPDSSPNAPSPDSNNVRDAALSASTELAPRQYSPSLEIEVADITPTEPPDQATVVHSPMAAPRSDAESTPSEVEKLTTVSLYHENPTSGIELRSHDLKLNVGPSELLVAVSYIAIDPIEVTLKTHSSITRTHYVGRDFTGTVVSVGDGLTEQFAIGNAVCGCLRGLTHDYLSTRTIIDPTKHVVFKTPTYLDGPAAAAMPTAYGTAWELVAKGPVILPDQPVLVIGGGTCVGSLVIQILKHKYGAERVYAVCSESSREYVEGLGAIETINYQSGNLSDLLLEIVGGFEENKFWAIYDCAGGYDALKVWPQILRKKSQGGMYLSCCGDFPRTGPQIKVREVVPFLPRNLTRMLLGRMIGINYHFVRWSTISPTAIDFLTENPMRVRVCRVYSINDANQAFSELESGNARGRIVIRMTDEVVDQRDTAPPDCLEDCNTQKKVAKAALGFSFFHSRKSKSPEAVENLAPPLDE